MARRGRRSDDSFDGLLIMIVLAIMAMPFVGLYLVCKGRSDGMRLLGVVMIIISVIFWIATQG